MRYLLGFFIGFLLFFSCQKTEKSTQIKSTSSTKITTDSVMNLMYAKWQFDEPSYTDAVYYVLNNWNEWRMMVYQVQQKPQKTLKDFQKKTTELLENIEKVQQTVPEKFQHPAIYSRINLLRTHVQKLDMYLELRPLPYKDILPQFAQINKDLVTISLQFQEQLQRKNMPTYPGEEKLKVKIDTTKKAMREALPK